MMFANDTDGQIQKKITVLQELYHKNHWPDQWLYDILREFHIWSLYSLRRGEGYQIPDHLKTWFNMIFSGRLVRIGRLIFDLKGRFGGKIKVFRKGKELMILFEPGLVFNEKGYRAKQGWTSSLVETDTFRQGNPISGGLAERRTVTLNRNEWTLILQYGDPVLGIHIPEDGPLTKEACLHSLQEAMKWFGTKEYSWNGFCCQSWLLDPMLSKSLPGNSNIVQFQKLGILYPTGIESDIKDRVYPGKFLDRIKEEEQKGHTFMNGGIFLLKENISSLFHSNREGINQ